MSQSPVLMQFYFHDRYLRQARLLENIKEQSQHLQLIESEVLRSDPGSLAEETVKLDFDVLRCACYFGERKFEEAARHDCTRLIVESIFDQTGGASVGRALAQLVESGALLAAARRSVSVVGAQRCARTSH